MSKASRATQRPYTDAQRTDILDTCLQYVDTHTISNAKTALDFIKSAISEGFQHDPDTDRFRIIEGTYNTQQITIWAASASPHSLAKAIRGVCEFIFAAAEGNPDLGIEALVGTIMTPNQEVERGGSFNEMNTSTVTELIHETTDVLMKRFIEPALNTHTTLYELENMVEYIDTIEDQAIKINYTFDYVETEMTHEFFESTEDRLSTIFQGNINPQHLAIPIIKGPSGCGKTRLGFEIARTMCHKTRRTYSKNASYFCLRMGSVVQLRSALFFTDTSNDCDNKENRIAYIIAVLLYAATNRKGLDGQEAQSLMQHAYDFKLIDFLAMLKRKLEIDLLFLQLDEYREDMLGSKMLTQACTDILLLQRDDAMRVYPIITGMTSYIEASEADHGRVNTVSSLTGTKVYTLGSLIGYKDALRDLEIQFVKKVLFQAIRYSNPDNTSIGDERVEAWPCIFDNEYFVGLMSELGGHPRFYTIALRHIFTRSYGRKLLDFCCKMRDINLYNDILRENPHDETSKDALKSLGNPPDLLIDTFHMRDDMIQYLSSIFSLATWESQIAQSIDFSDAPLTGRERGTIIRDYSIRALKVLLILAITEMPLYKNWNFNSALGSTNNQDFHFDLTIEAAEHSGIFSIIKTGSRSNSGEIRVQMSPILIATLNESCKLMSSMVLTCIPNFGTYHDLVDTLYIRLCAFVISKSVDRNYAYSDFDKLRRDFTPFDNDRARFLTERHRFVIINDILDYGIYEIRKFSDFAKSDPSSYTIAVSRNDTKHLFDHNNTPIVCSTVSPNTVFEGISVFSVVRTDNRGRIDDDDLNFSNLSFVVCLSFHLPENSNIELLVENINYTLKKNMFKKLVEQNIWFILDVAYFHMFHTNEVLAEFNEKLTENFASRPNFIGYYLTPIGETSQFQSTYKHQPRSLH